MKLRLPHRFQAALIAALASVSLTTLSTGTLTVAAGAALLAGQTYGRELTQVTTTAGDVTYNGYVFNMLLDNTNAFAKRNFYRSTYDEATKTWTNIDPKYTSSNTTIETPYGDGGFWTMYSSTPNPSGVTALPYYGTTLRLTGSTSSTAEGYRKLQTDFTDFTIGGLIADDEWGSTQYNVPAYWFWRGGSMDIDGYNAVNMDINSYVRFSYGGSVNMKKGGTWNIHSGKTLEFDNNSSNTATTFKFYENQALTVQGGGKLTLGRSSNGTYNVEMQTGSSLLITGNSTVEIGATTGAITVNGTITVDTGSTLNINNNKIVTIADGASVIKKGSISGNGKISGTGTYELAGTTSLGVSLDAGWAGTVRISDASDFQNIDIDNFGHAGSAVELNGVTGFFKSAQGAGVTFNSKLVIGNDGFTWKDNGYSNSTYELKGGIGGSGTFTYRWKAQTFKVTGDVTDWNGTFLMDTGNDATFKFSGQATVVNAKFQRPKGTLNMEVGNGTESFSTTFKNTVEASALTIKDKASATFANTVSAASVSVAAGGSLVLGNSLTTTGDLSVADGATLKFAGTDKLTVGGSLTLGGQLDVSNITYTAGATVNLASYGGTLNYSGATLTGLAAGVEATLGDSGTHLTLTFATPPTPTPEFGNDLGKVMYVGDSITDGVGTQHSWRYSFFKILADEGIGQAEEGYFQNVHTNRQNAPFTDSYGNHTFANTHSAQASVRSYETAATKTGSSRLGNSSIQNWLGQSDTMRNGAQYTGPVYSGDAAPDTFFMLLGTNDLLSDYSNTLTDANYAAVVKSMFDYENGQFGGTNGTFDIILDSMLEANPEAKLVLLDMPTWYGYRTGSGAHAAQSDFNKMTAFNQVLREWVATKADKANITVVNSSEGMIALADAKVNTGVRRMFIDDGLHPSNQGELIIAGNVAKALGYGGRTMGQARMGATGSAFKNLELTPEQGGTVAKTWTEAGLDVTGSYTVDITSLQVGDGGTPGTPGSWNTGDLLSITVGNGDQQGVLNVNEAYIQWGNDILYSMDMSQNAEALRISYITGEDLPSGYSAGYFVWLGDMMIGESLASSTGTTSGVSISWSGDSPVTMGTVSAAAGAYAPALAPGHYENAEGLYLVGNTKAAIPWVQPTDESIGHIGLNQTASGTYVAGAHVDTSGAGTGTYTTVTGGSGVSALYANSGNHSGDVYMLVNGVTMSGSGTYGWIAAQSSGMLTGDASVKVENSGNSKAMLFGTVSGNITGNVYTEVNGGTFACYTSSNRASYAGSYQGNISGKATLLTTGGVFEDSVFGGVHNGNGYSIGSTLLDLRGGLFKGNVYGGGAAGTVNSGASVVISGDAVVNGNVYGGGIGGTVNGGATVTLTGGLVRGSVFGGGSSGTVNGGTSVVVEQGAAVQGNIYGNTDTVQGGTVTIKDRTAGFGHAGSILTETLNIQNTQGTVTSKATAATVNATGDTAATLTDLTLKPTAAMGTTSINVAEGASLSLDGKLNLQGLANYTGELSLEDGLVINMVSSGGAYSDGDNGYRLESETIVMQRSSDSSSLVVDASKLVGAGILADAVFTYDDTAGILHSSVQAEHQTYCVNTGSVTYGAPQSDITDATTVRLQSSSAATLTLAQNLAPATTGGIVVADTAVDAVIRINKFEADGTTPIVLKAENLHADGAVSLTGAGVFYLSDNTSTMPAALASGASGWTGTVRLCTTTANTKINEETLVNGTYSTLEMNGFNGWFDNNHWYGARNLNIKFTDLAVGDATTYAWSCGAYISKGDERELELSGTLSGDGTFNRTGGNIMHYAYSGNISDWTGKFLMTGGGRTKLTFKGNATDVKVAIEQQGNGTLNVNVQNGATFSNDIKGVSSFTVAADKAATLQGEGKDRQLGNVTLENNAGLNIMSIADAAKLSVGDVTIGTGATMGVYSGDTATVGTETEGSIAITENHVLSVLNDATLNANLVMKAGSKLDVHDAQLGNGLHMGSKVTLEYGTLLTNNELGEPVADFNDFLFEYLSSNPYYSLYDSVDELYIQQGAEVKRFTQLDFVNWRNFDLDASRVFTNLDENTYALVYNWNADNTGRVALVMIPEPTTGTLSLLALCALAARRRRK